MLAFYGCVFYANYHDLYFPQRETAILSNKAFDLVEHSVENFKQLILKTATRKKLQRAVDKIDRNNIHRCVCSRLNSLLGFIGRRERLKAVEYTETPTIFNEDDFLNLVQNLRIQRVLKIIKKILKIYFSLSSTRACDSVKPSLFLTSDKLIQKQAGNLIISTGLKSLCIHKCLKVPTKCPRQKPAKTGLLRSFKIILAE